MKVPHAVDYFSGQLILLGQVVAKSIQLTFDAAGVGVGGVIFLGEAGTFHSLQEGVLTVALGGD